MALNTAHASGGVLIYNTERILIFYDGVEMGFDMSSNLSQFKGNKKGRAYLTTHRVIFNTKDAKESLQSFSMPFYTMREVELEQPVFGANYIKGKVKSEPGGNWEGNGKWKMWFNHGGAIEFGKAMLQAGRLASRHMVSQPPPYKPPSAPYYQAPPPAYTPPQGGMYGFVPYQTFPDPPPYNTVFMVQDPPPYPGIDPSLQAYPPPSAGQAPPYPQPPAGQAAPYPQPPAGQAPPYPQAAPWQAPPAGQAPPYPQAAPWQAPPAGQAPLYPQQQGTAYPPQNPPYPQGEGNGFTPGSAAEAKYTEAMSNGGNAYYNPSNPHNIYMPAQASAPPTGATAPPSYVPPSYNADTKKSQ